MIDQHKQLSNYMRTANWLGACGKEPGKEALSVQIGVHIEEFVEFLSCLDLPQGALFMLARASDSLEDIAKGLKANVIQATIPDIKRIDALDALCDTEVTGNGVAYLAGFNKDLADQNVLASNESKLENGMPVILPGGKIGKGVDYIAPNLTAYV